MATFIYQCDHCRQFTESASPPSPIGCPESMFHWWYKLAPASPAVSAYCRRLLPSKPDLSPDELESCLPPLAQNLAALKAKRDACQQTAERTPGLLLAFTSGILDPDQQSYACSQWLAAKLDPHGDHPCGPLLLKQFLQTLSTSVHPPHPATKQFYPPALGKIDCSQAQITAPTNSPDRCSAIMITLPHWGNICIANTVNAYGCDETPKCVNLFNAQPPTPNLHRLLLYLTPEGTALESPKNLQAPYFLISYRKHISQWLKACLHAVPATTAVTASLRQLTSVISVITEGRFPWEYEYMQSVEQLIRQNPAIIASVNDLKQAVTSLGLSCFNRHWDAVQRELAGTGIIIGEITLHNRLNIAYWPVRIAPACPLRKPGTLVRPKIWRRPLGEELCISLTLPKHLGDAAARIINADSKDGWLNATELPYEFSNEALTRLVHHPEELEKLTAETVAAIQQFIRRAQSLCSKEPT
jgi:hypothetical protein